MIRAGAGWAGEATTVAVVQHTEGHGGLPFGISVVRDQAHCYGSAVATGGIYLRQGEGLVQMTEQPYETEDVLQALLADHPDLLAGDQAAGEPRRWLLLAREAPLGDAERDARWSVDHLFVDQDAIPTIVEVKRSSDTRIRREVIGQMLEYAANAVSYWRLDDLRARVEAAATSKGQNPESLLLDLIGDDGDPAEFWEQVKTNLAASKLRLVFVADAIPPELRRLVEFLNEQMQNTEVLAVEVKQYVDAKGQHQTLVPRLVGQTEKARQAKTWTTKKPPGRHWDRDALLSTLAERQGPDAVAIAQRIFAWSDERHLVNKYGIGQKNASVAFLAHANGVSPFLLYAAGGIEIFFQALHRRPPFDQAEMRSALQRRLNTIPGIAIPDDRLTLRPGFDLSTLADTSSLSSFLEAMDWALDELIGIDGAPASTPVR